MTCRQIINIGHPTLRKKAKLVVSPDEEIRLLAEDMIETMHVNGGIGLAAPQVNASLSVLVYDLSTKDVAVDPVVLFKCSGSKSSY